MGASTTKVHPTIKILSETRTVAEAWKGADPVAPKTVMEYWVDDLWIVVEPIHG